MKKRMLAVMLLLFVMGTSLFFFTKTQTEALNYEVIPDEAIRLRILANSDVEEDQKLKRDVRDAVNREITEWVKEMDTIVDARVVIQENLDEIEAIVDNVLTEAGAHQPYTVEYDRSVTFPTKLYGSYIYPAGEYEAILITIGDGEGANWWCVLFPPMCFLDFGNGATVEKPASGIGLDDEAELEDVSEKEEAVVQHVLEEGEEEVEVKFFLTEWFGFL
ncbi:stage II sporulation protein R [Pontibacillus halophilus JSM 076056 = DSM 19796]|uniref:Stage II sporulation protein R n=1 Tax=Pontibacillus halophilus JSM 076056 = DSM 19796 TaxID=1385510 RepID=A0A0A5GPG1_9BACI|nr:stage II sporulation protein R [Pontibacillus halophilus]KGX93874.1 stage II sporulation protein R [Pontibacillus halophilus JSM 076056 = DSM 19796]